MSTKVATAIHPERGESAPGASRLTVAECTSGPGPKALAPARVVGRRRGAEILHRAHANRLNAGDASASHRAVAARFRVSHAVPQRWADPDSGVAIAFGDVLALAPELRREVLTLALADCDASAGGGPVRVATDPTTEVLVLMSDVGDAAVTARLVVRDGVVTAEEWQQVAARAERIERDARAAKLAALAAADVARSAGVQAVDLRPANDGVGRSACRASGGHRR